MNDRTVEIAGLSKVYSSGSRRTVAVENLDLNITRGEIFGLLGPNGAGKTTTVRMICGLIPISSGSIKIDGMDVTQQPDQVRRKIGLLPEDAGDFKNLTLDEELEYHGAMFGLSPAQVRERSKPLVDRLGLGDRKRHRLKTFSRGMRRKFHLIRALLHRPSLLLLDEPTAGLDPAIVEEVWTLLKEAAVDNQVTVILCSHHLEEVERLCGRVAILQRKLLIQGTLAELSGGEGAYQLQMLGDSTAFVNALTKIEGIESANAEAELLKFVISGDPQRVLPRVVREVVNAGGEILGLSRDERDLRTLYRSIVSVGVNQPAAKELANV